MLKNTAIQITKAKLAGASLLSGSLILVGGYVVWQLWRNQAQLQTKTSELSNELKDVKKQVAEFEVANINQGPAPTSTVPPSLQKMADLSSSLKEKALLYFPKSTSK